MSRFEQFRDSQLETILGPEECLTFANAIVWPAIDHIYGTDFRARAQRKQKTRLPKKTRATDEERITIFAEGDHRRTFTVDEIGESFRVCTTTLILAEMHPELKDGILQVAEAEGSEDGEYKWWNDTEVDWTPWESRSYYFSTDPNIPFSSYHSLEAHNEEERTLADRYLWDFDGEDFSTDKERLSHRRHRPRQLKKINEKIAQREQEFMKQLSVRECLEIRAALIRFGVPAEVLMSNPSG